MDKRLKRTKKKIVSLTEEEKIHYTRYKTIKIKKKEADFFKESGVLLTPKITQMGKLKDYNGTVLDLSEKQKLPILVLDKIYGREKDIALIKFINSQNEQVKFLYVTHFLKSAGEIVSNCPTKEFTLPKSRKTKLDDLKTLLKNRRNIVCSNLLFLNFDQECKELVQNGNYTLIIDSSFPVIRNILTNRSDLDIILKESNQESEKGYTLAKIDEAGRCIWTEKNYSKAGVFYEYKALFENNAIYYINKGLISCFSPDYFNSFNRVVITSYLFEYQVFRSYCNLFNLEYKFLHTDDSSCNIQPEIFDTPQEEKISEYKKLIEVENTSRFCFIEKDFKPSLFKTTLSRNWLKNNPEYIEILKKKNK